MRRQRSSSRTAGDDKAPQDLPRPILDKLRALIRRVRRVQIIRGSFATLAAAAIAVITIMAIGATFTILSSGVHATLSILGLLAVAATAYRTLFIPLRKELSIPQIARVIESRHPKLQERISTAIELLGSDDPEALRGSEQLLAEVVKSATADARVVKPEREFTNRTARRYMVACGSAAALLLAALLIFPGQSGRLLTRVVAPFSKVGNAYADQLIVEPGNVRVAAGDPVTIRVTVRKPDAERAVIRRTHPATGNRESIESMTLIGRDREAGTSEFAITFPAVSEDFRYRIRSGRAVGAIHQVTAASRPEVTRLEVSYFYPAYTKLPPQIFDALDQEIVALEGTKIQVSANFDRQLDSASFMIDGNPLPATEDRSDNRANPRTSWNFDMAAGTEGYWKLALTDTKSIRNRPAELPIRSFDDQVPAVRLLTSQANLRVRPSERLSLAYEVVEDFGLASAELHVSAGERVFRQHLPALTGPGSYTGKAVLDVSRVSLGGTKTFQIFIQVADTRPDPQIAKSAPITITVDAGAESLAEQFVNDQRESMQASLVAAIEKLQAARVLSTPIPRELVRPDIIPLEILQQLAKVQTLTGEAERLVRETAAAAGAPSSLFKVLAPALLGTADDHLVTARQAAEEIPLTDEKVTRVHRAHRVNSEIDEGIADLNVAIRELKQQTARAQLVAKMSDLGEKQRQLAEELAATTDPAERQRLQEQQAALAEAMNELVKESEKSIADQLQDARQDASELAEQASELAGRQAQLAQLLDQAEDPALREEAGNELIRQLEVAQREIGNQALELHKIAKRDAPDETLLAELEGARTNAHRAADLLTENKLSDAATTAADNAVSLRQLEQSVDHPQLRSDLDYLAKWQGDVARQIDALARQRLDEALASVQEMVAEQAAELARDADDFRQRAEALADPTALQQVQQASSQASQAAQSARQASSQLGGETSTGAFDFARDPSRVRPNQNRPPNAPPIPTQAGVQDPLAQTQFNDGPPPAGDDQLPDMSSIEGTRDNPFSVGEVSIDTLPPALADGSMNITGGRLPPGTLPQTPTQPPPSTGGESSATGQNSIASAAQQPAMQAQHGLSGAAGSLANAASSLGQQANSPSAQQQPQINQQMLEAAQQAAQVIAEKDPEVAAKLAEQVAQKLTQDPVAPIARPAVKDWQRIRGKVKSGIASQAKSTTPDEYRDLVKSYFKEIARRSNENAPAKP